MRILSGCVIVSLVTLIGCGSSEHETESSAAEQTVRTAEVMGFNVWYSDASGDALENPIVITGAEYDLVGTAAAFEWLVSQYGTLDADWRMLLKRAWGDEELFIDEYVIELPSGEERHHFFDLTESYLKWPD